MSKPTHMYVPTRGGKLSDYCKGLCNEEDIMRDVKIFTPSDVDDAINSGKYHFSRTEITATMKFIEWANEFMRNFQKFVGADDHGGNGFPQPATEENIKRIIVNTRTSCMICHGCLKSCRDPKNFRGGEGWRPCSACNLVFYCSDECELTGSQYHKSIYCCKDDAPLEIPQVMTAIAGKNIKILMEAGGKAKVEYISPIADMKITSAADFKSARIETINSDMMKGILYEVLLYFKSSGIIGDITNIVFSLNKGIVSCSVTAVFDNVH